MKLHPHRALWVLLLAAASLIAQKDAAQAAFRRGDYADAERQLEILVQKEGLQDATTLLNLARCSVEQGSSARGLYWARCALELKPHEERLQTMVRELESDLRTSPMIEPGVLGRTQDMVLRQHPFQNLLLVLLPLALTMGLSWLPLKPRKWKLIAGGLWCLAAALLLVTILARWTPKPPAGVALHLGATVRSEPLPSAPVVARLTPGTTAEVVGVSPDWTQVRLPTGLAWVSTSSLASNHPRYESLLRSGEARVLFAHKPR